jgi:hypothetical protein
MNLRGITPWGAPPQKMELCTTITKETCSNGQQISSWMRDDVVLYPGRPLLDQTVSARLKNVQYFSLQATKITDCNGRNSYKGVLCLPEVRRESMLWSGCLVWMVPGAPSKVVWRVLRCPSKQGTSSVKCCCAFSACAWEKYLHITYFWSVIAFVWLYVSWFYSQGRGYGLVGPLFR